MKNKMMLIGFLGVLFACNGAEKSNNKSNVSSKIPAASEIVKEEGKNKFGYYEDEKNETSYLEGGQKLIEDESENPTNPERHREKKAEETSIEKIEKPSKTPDNEVQKKPGKDNVEEDKNEVKKSSEPITIFIEVVPDEMRFDIETFTVTAGQEVTIELDNLDGMEHNLLILKPGTLEKVGAAADALTRDPKAAQKHYVPEIPEVLFATEMLEPGEFATLTFTAPEKPGEYPFVCTFPGHWRMMNGVMKVVEKE